MYVRGGVSRPHLSLLFHPGQHSVTDAQRHQHPSQEQDSKWPLSLEEGCPSCLGEEAGDEGQTDHCSCWESREDGRGLPSQFRIRHRRTSGEDDAQSALCGCEATGMLNVNCVVCRNVSL